MEPRRNQDLGYDGVSDRERRSETARRRRDGDVVGDNRGRGDVGNVNFKIQVPLNTIVDIETKMGDITIANIRGDLVRAYVSSEGDIELTGIYASKVFAQNTSGHIFFDGEVNRGGNYQFQSGKGDISIRIPANSSFDLIASAPDRKLALGQFWNSSFKTLGEGQKFSKTVTNVNDGRAKVTIINFQGGITFTVVRFNFILFRAGASFTMKRSLFLCRAGSMRMYYRVVYCLVESLMGLT